MYASSDPVVLAEARHNHDCCSAEREVEEMSAVERASPDLVHALMNDFNAMLQLLGQDDNLMIDVVEAVMGGGRMEDIRGSFRWRMEDAANEYLIELAKDADWNAERDRLVLNWKVEDVL